MPAAALIRTGLPDDARRLAVLASQVWLHTYATDGVTGDIARYVLTEFTPERLATSLADPDACILVAECGEGCVGFAVVGFDAPCPAPVATRTELRTLYVQAHFLGHGIGKALILAAQARARERAGTPLWLKVNARNDRAIAFYARQGYRKVGTTHFLFGQGRHENHVLVGADA